MPTKVIAAKQLTAWSYSRLSTYQTCPAKAKYQFIDKMVSAPNEAMARGSQIHTLSEQYVNGALKTLPKELESFTAEYKHLRKLWGQRNKPGKPQVFAELQWGFNKDWVVCEWFGKACWLRVVIDIMVDSDTEMDVIDVKTGQVRDEHKEQLSLYAAAAFSKSPSVEKVNTKLWYVDKGIEVVETYERELHEAQIKQWNKAAKPLLSDRNFAPKPSGLCRWCDFSVSKGGPCKY